MGLNTVEVKLNILMHQPVITPTQVANRLLPGNPCPVETHIAEQHITAEQVGSGSLWLQVRGGAYVAHS